MINLSEQIDAYGDSMINLSEQIDAKVKEITENHAQVIEEIIKKLIVENDCKPSDVVMMVKGQMHYSFMIKKFEHKTEINFTWNAHE